MQVAKHVYGSDEFKIEEHPHHYHLQFLNSYTGLYKYIPKIMEKYFPNVVYKHADNISDLAVTKMLLQAFTKTYNLDYNKLVELSNKSVLLSIMPYGRDDIKFKSFSEISDKDLEWFSKNTNDKNLEFTCKIILDNRGQKLKPSHKIQFGKYKDLRLNNQTIPVEYLAYLYNEGNTISHNVKEEIKAELLNRGFIDPFSIITYDPKYPGKLIADKSVPVSVLEAGLSSRINVTTKELIKDEIQTRKMFDSPGL
jgi:hypothetical protein